MNTAITSPTPTIAPSPDTSTLDPQTACTRSPFAAAVSAPAIGEGWSRSIEPSTQPAPRVAPVRTARPAPSLLRRIAFDVLDAVRFSASPSDRALAQVDGARRSPRG